MVRGLTFLVAFAHLILLTSRYAMVTKGQQAKLATIFVVSNIKIELKNKIYFLTNNNNHILNMLPNASKTHSRFCEAAEENPPYEYSSNQIKQSEIRQIERPRSKSNPTPYIYYRNKHNNVVPQEGLMIGGEYITEEQFHEYYIKRQSDIKEWDEQYLKEIPKTKKTESMFGYLYRILVYDTQNNKKEAEKEKYKETIEHLEVRTPSWPLFVDKEDFNNDVLNQQKITIEKKMLDDLEHYTVFKWSPISLRKTTTPMSEKSAENSPPITTYFTKKSKISP